jgi:hypothetical protein
MVQEQELVEQATHHQQVRHKAIRVETVGWKPTIEAVAVVVVLVPLEEIHQVEVLMVVQEAHLVLLVHL